MRYRSICEVTVYAASFADAERAIENALLQMDAEGFYEVRFDATYPVDEDNDDDKASRR